MATVSTNVGKPPKKKKKGTQTATSKTAQVVMPKVEVVVDAESKFHRGKTTKTYEHARIHTGHKEYGKENPKNKDAQHIEDARAKKQDIAYDKEGKPYRAGVTTVTKDPDKIQHKTFKIKVTPGKKPEAVKPTKTAAEIRQKGGNVPVRKMPRVEYLRNKDAKGGISKERSRQKKESGY